MSAFRFVAFGGIFCALASYAQQEDSLTIHHLHPRASLPGGWITRGMNGFHTPYIHEVELDPDLVQRLLPTRLAPRLLRPDTNRFSRIFLHPGFLKLTGRVLRRVDRQNENQTSFDLADLFPHKVVHTFALTRDRLTFARAGKSFGKDMISKHAIIPPDLKDVRFSGQMWRDGDTFCFNANSGTFMKKRKQLPGLQPAPKPAPMLVLMRKLFEPALRVAFCREIAPGYGASEAVDQADKALIAADNAEEAAEQTSGAKAMQLRGAAADARAQAEKTYAASEAVGSARDEEEYWKLDTAAADAADEVQEYRDRIEDMLKKDGIKLDQRF